SMTLGARLTLSLAVPLVLVMVLFGYIDERTGRALLQDELAREGRALARTVQIAMEDALRDRQIEDVRTLVDRVTGYERVLGLRIFDGRGTIIYEPPDLASSPFAASAALKSVLESGKASETHGPHVSVERPVAALARSFREVGSGDLRARVPVRRGDEFGRLAQEFNGMCERLQASQRSLLDAQEERRRMEERLRHAERLAAIGR